MGKVVSSAPMSLDSFIDNPAYTVLFDWHEIGDIEVPTAVEELSFALTPPSAHYLARLDCCPGALGSRNTVTEFR